MLVAAAVPALLGEAARLVAGAIRVQQAAHAAPGRRVTHFVAAHCEARTTILTTLVTVTDGT